MTAFVCLGMLFYKQSEVAANAIGEVNLKEQVKSAYSLGEEFEVPTAEIVYNGKTYATTSSMLVYPDGNIYSGDIHALTMAGIYTLRYTAENDGETIIGETSLRVIGDFYNVTGGATLEFVDSIKMSPDVPKSGLKTSIPVGGAFRVSEAIDISNSDLSTPLMTIYPHNCTRLNGGNGYDNIEAKEIDLKIIDCYDESNFITFQITWFKTSSATSMWLRGSSYGNPLIGLYPWTRPDAPNGKTVLIDGTQYLVYNSESSPYGVGTHYINVGGVVVRLNNADNRGFSLYMEQETKRLYFGENLYGTDKIFVTDLDNQDVYDEAFKGFTTGEVYFELSASSYNANLANIEISDIYGKSGKDLHITQTADTRKPVIVPEIVVDEPLYIAKGEEVELISAKAYDINLKSFTTELYYGYGTARQSKVGYIDGKFTPKQCGKYTIVYTATDAFGYTASETVTLECIECKDNKLIDFSVKQVTTASAGESLILPEYTVKSRNGKVNVKTYYAFEGGELVEIDSNTREFFVENVGVYSITYIYEDIMKSYERSYDFTATASGNVVFSNALLPEYFIKNAAYTLEDVYAYTYTEKKPQEKAVKVFAKADDGVFEEIDPKCYMVDASSKVQFRYEYEGETMLSEVIEVIDVGYFDYLKMDKYFVGDMSATAVEDYIRFETSEAGEHTLDFINVISLSTFQFSFDIPTDGAGFSELEIKLIDFYDRSNTTIFTYQKSAGSACSLYYKGVPQVCIGNFGSGTLRTLYFDQAYSVFKESSGLTFAWQENFTSDKILLHITLRGCDGTSAVNVRMVNNQLMGNADVDFIGASVVAKNLYGGVQEKGTKITVYESIVTDVLTPYLRENHTFYVLAPNGSYVTADDGTLLSIGCDLTKSYTFTVTEYGAYTVKYSYTDYYGNVVDNMYAINVEDTQKPDVQIAGGANENTVVSVKLNSEVSVKGYTASDNETPADDLSVTVLTVSPYNTIDIVEGGKFVADRVGDWKVYYYVYDGEGNSTVRYYVVRVK